MASIQPTSSAENTTSFRTRGRSLLLLCVLMINVLLVAVAPMMRPETATAQPSGPKDAEEPKATKTPEPVQVADATAQAAPAVEQATTDSKVDNTKLDSPASVSDSPKSGSKDVLVNSTNPAADQHETQHDSSANPPEVTEVDPSSVTDHAPAPTETQSASSSPVNAVASETEDESIARVEVSPPTPSDVETAADTSPAITPPDPTAAPDLLIVNPAETGGTVFYLVDGEVQSLEPGESHNLKNGRQYTIEYHRGGEFGEAELQVQSGTYHFRVDNAGWKLAAAHTSDTE